MATFEAQVNGLTGLGATLSASTTPTDSQLDQFLKDGVIDVTNRVIAVRPQDIDNFLRENSGSSALTTFMDCIIERCINFCCIYFVFEVNRCGIPLN